MAAGVDNDASDSRPVGEAGPRDDPPTFASEALLGRTLLTSVALEPVVRGPAASVCATAGDARNSASSLAASMTGSSAKSE